MLSSIRPDDWNLSLFFHVLGAMVMVGSIVLALAYIWGADRDRTGAALMRGFRVLVMATIPAYLVMRVFAEVIYEKEFGDAETDPSWIGIGYGVADLGLLFILFATLTAWLGARRMRRAAAEGNESAAAASVRTATVLVSVVLLADVIAIWAMTAKPL